MPNLGGKSLTQCQTFTELALLRSLIEACRGLSSTPPYNYVYGLVRLATDGGKLAVNYSKSKEEVNLDVLDVTQHMDDMVLWKRMLLEHLNLLFSFMGVSNAFAKQTKQGGRLLD